MLLQWRWDLCRGNQVKRRSLRWGPNPLSVCVCVCVCVCVRARSQSLSRVLLFATPQTIACQAPLSMGFSKQEHWSGLLFPSPEGLPTQESSLGLLHLLPCR